LSSSVLRRWLRVRPIKVREKVEHGLSVVRQDVDEAQAESCPAESGECLSRYRGIVYSYARSVRARSRTQPCPLRYSIFIYVERP
jgi:hypothetical protein